jgi:2'-5' RNA ligase
LLLLAKPKRDLFCDIIRILRKAFRTPTFEPHLTLFVTTQGAQQPGKVLRQIRARPIRLRVRNVAYSSKFTKTLYVRFKSDPALKKIATDLASAAKIRAKPPSDPHVSLLYKKLPAHVQKELAAVIKLPFRSVVFDSIAAVRLHVPVRSASDVDRWKVVARKSLRR